MTEWSWSLVSGLHSPVQTRGQEPFACAQSSIPYRSRHKERFSIKVPARTSLEHVEIQYQFHVGELLKNPFFCNLDKQKIILFPRLMKYYS